MRLLNLILVLLLIAVIGTCAAAWFDLVTVPVVSNVAWNMKGYGEASNPDEAIEKYNKALEDRNYNAAARYLDGDYQIQFRKQAKMASKLASAIDNFRSTAKDRGINSDKIEDILNRVEPYPKRITAKDVKKTDDKATAVVSSEGSSRLVGPEANVLQLKKVENRWLIDIPLNRAARDRFDWVDKNAQNVVNALNVVKNRMKTDSTTKENVHADLLAEVKEALRPE